MCRVVALGGVGVTGCSRRVVKTKWKWVFCGKCALQLCVAYRDSASYDYVCVGVGVRVHVYASVSVSG